MQQFFSLLSWRLFTVVLCSWSGRPARTRTHHDYHHDTKVKPEAATAIIELLMMGGKTPETCWAVNEGQDNKLENCCIWLVIYLKSYRYFGEIFCSHLLTWIFFINAVDRPQDICVSYERNVYFLYMRDMFKFYECTSSKRQSFSIQV